VSWFGKKPAPQLSSLRVWPQPPPHRIWATFDPNALLRLRDYMHGIPNSYFTPAISAQYMIVEDLVKFILDNAVSTGGDVKHNEDGTVIVKRLTTSELIGLRDFVKARSKEDKGIVGLFCMLNDVVLKAMKQGHVDCRSQYTKDLELLASHDDAVALSITAFNERMQPQMQCIKQNGYGTRCVYDAKKDSNYCEKHAKTWWLQDEGE